MAGTQDKAQDQPCSFLQLLDAGIAGEMRPDKDASARQLGQALRQSADARAAGGLLSQLGQPQSSGQERRQRAADCRTVSLPSSALPPLP